MSLYLGTTEITKLRDLAPQTGLDITDIWFGSTNVYTVWQTYEGTLPATIISTGDDMKQYQIYGATGGVGEPTENLLDESTLVKGFYDRIDDKIIINPIAKGSIVFRSFRQSLTPGTYTVSFEHNVNIVRAIVDDVISSNVAENISSYTVTTQTGDIGFSMRRTTSSQTPWDNNPTMLTEGTTPPETYVPYGYEVDMATGTNILQNSEIEKDGWQAQVGTTPQKIVNPKRCRSKDMYPISGEKIFYDFKSLNINIAFIDSGGLSLGGSGFKSGVGSVDVPANAVKCFFIIANTDANTNITPAQVIAAGIWASVDATTTPIYIGDDPLDKDEYVGYQEGKVFRYGNNIFDSSAKSGANGYVNDRYLTSTGSLQPSSLWYVSEYMGVEFKKYKVVSGIQSAAVIAEYDENKNFIAAHAYTSGIKITFDVLSNCKYLRMSVYKNVENSTSLNALQPTDPPVALPALPTCEGETVIDYAGESVAPEKAILKYRKEGF